MSGQLTTSAIPQLRRIKAINKGNITPAQLKDPPEFRWLKVHKLRVNDAYQRGLSTRSMNLIRKVIQEFDWAKYHAPVVVQITPDTGLDDDTYEILDGQHTAIAAASHGSLHSIPCFIVRADTIIDKADAFVGLNQSKINVTPIQVFWAEIGAAKEEALEVQQGAQQAGATIVKRMPPYGDFEVGETVAIATLKKLARRGGASYVKRVLEVGVQSDLAPIGQDFIIAFDYLLLKDSPLKLVGPYDELRWQISQAIRRITVESIMDAATSRKRHFGGSIGQNLAFLIKKDIDDVRDKQLNITGRNTTPY